MYILIDDDLNTYVNSSPIARKSSPLKWWQLMRLALLGRAVLSKSTTQAKSKRLNSVFGYIFKSRRTCTIPKHVNEITFLHDNVKVEWTMVKGTEGGWWSFNWF